MPKTFSQKGFSLIETATIVLIVAIVAACGWIAWRHTHNKPAPTHTSGTQQKQSTSNPYDGWKTYCDTTYKYCFRYPKTWKFSVTAVAQEPCDEGQATITSPDSEVMVTYTNENNHDRQIAPLSIISIDTFAATGQSFSIAGGYSAYGTGYLPTYNLADSSLLDTYPLKVGSTSDFPTTASFNDRGGGCSGSFLAQPLQQSATAAEAKTWFTTSDAQTSLLILKSLSYQP